MSRCFVHTIQPYAVSQRINGAAFAFSAAMPPLLAVSASEGIRTLTSSPSLLSILHENVRLVQSILEKVEGIYMPSHQASPIIHIQLPPPTGPRTSMTSVASHGWPSPPVKRPSSLTVDPTVKPSNPQSVLPAQPLQFDVEAEERVLQEVVDEALAQGVLITRAKRLRGQEVVEPRPTIKLAVTAALSKKETEKAAQVIKNALVKVLGKRKRMGTPSIP